jgi:hypothetical protein
MRRAAATFLVSLKTIECFFKYHALRKAIKAGGCNRLDNKRRILSLRYKYRRSVMKTGMNISSLRIKRNKETQEKTI